MSEGAAARPLVIAHRGASFELPENSLDAFERAIEVGADYVEFDVQPTVEGELVVVHDRLRGVPLAELRETRRDLATLRDVLDLCAGRIGIVVELKHPHAHRRHDPLARTLAALDAHAVDPEGVVLLGFEPRALERAQSLRPGLRTALHLGWRRSAAAAAGFWGVGLAHEAARPTLVRRAHARGLETIIYTVNDRARMLELAALGVSGIVTDRPDLLRRTLAEDVADPGAATALIGA